jgi:hypothetical protein
MSRAIGFLWHDLWQVLTDWEFWVLLAIVLAFGLLGHLYLYRQERKEAELAQKRIDERFGNPRGHGNDPS